MSLYEGMGVESKPAEESAGWSSSYKLMRTQLQVKKASLIQQQAQKRKQTTTLAPVVDLKKSNSGDDFNMEIGGVLGESILSAVNQEYDPLRPNEYEKVIKSRQKEKDIEREKDREKRREERDRQRRERDPDYARRFGIDSGFSRPYQAEGLEEEQRSVTRSATGAAIAPPPSLLTEDYGDSDDGSSKKGPGEGDEISGRVTPPFYTPASFGIGNSVVASIMTKYGYKEGQGLGKHEQGISTALAVEKTSKRGGKIIPAEQIVAQMQELVKKEKQDTESITEIMKNPTKVILLRNMVGPGDVDEDLEPETAEECEKYGEVVRVVVYEIPQAPDDESVRIFVEFKRIESAIKALVDLNGRYFGGRVVKGGFYDYDKYKNFQLGS